MLTIAENTLTLAENSKIPLKWGIRHPSRIYLNSERFRDTILYIPLVLT